VNTALIPWRMIRKNYPVQVILFVTAKCNFRCDMCFYWESTVTTPPSEEMSLEEFQKLSQTMKPFPWLLIGGGEPFIRRDLQEIVEAFILQNRVRYVTIPTNAWHTERIVESAERLCRNFPDVQLNIDLSFLGADGRHDSICGVDGALTRLNQTYERLQPLRRQWPNLGLGAIFTMARQNQDQAIATLQSLVREYRFDSIVLAKARGLPRVSDAVDIDVERYIEACDYVERLVRQGVLPGFPGFVGKMVQAKDVMVHRMIVDTARGRGQPIPCYAARLSVVISETGIVRPCELTDNILGDLRRTGMDFRAVWNSQSSREIRKRIRETQCNCTHECFLTTNVLFNPKLLAKIAIRTGRRMLMTEHRSSLPAPTAH